MSDEKAAKAPLQKRGTFHKLKTKVNSFLEPNLDNDYDLCDADGKLPAYTKFAYGLPGFATTSLSFLISVYSTDFYVSLGTNLGFISFFTALARSFDVITDPLMGWWSDRTRSKMGRRRPYIFYGAPFYGILFVLLFWPPPFYWGPGATLIGPQGKEISEFALDNTPYTDAGTKSDFAAMWFGVFYTIFYFSDTYSNVPYEALGPELTPSYVERSNVFFTAKMFNFAGMLFAAGAPAMFSYFIRYFDRTYPLVDCLDFYHTDFQNKKEEGPKSLYIGDRLNYYDGETERSADSCYIDPGEICFEQKFEQELEKQPADIDGKPCMGYCQTSEAQDGREEDIASNHYWYEQNSRIVVESCNPTVYTNAYYTYIENWETLSKEDQDANPLEDGTVIRSTDKVSFFNYMSYPSNQQNKEAETITINFTDSTLTLCDPFVKDSCDKDSTVINMTERKSEFEKYHRRDLDATMQAFLIVSAFFGIWYLILMWHLILFGVKKERSASSESTPVPLVASVLRSFKNVAFRPLLIAWALDGLGLSALVTMFPFFIRYVVIPNGVLAQEGTLPGLSPMVCMATCVFALLSMAMVFSPAWLWLSNKKGKYKAWLWYNVINVFTNILFIFASEGDPFLSIFISGLNGVAVGGQFLINSILADVIDYDEFLNGTRSEGAFSVFATLIPKFVSIPASAIPLAVINMLGFDKDLIEQLPNVKGFIRYTFVLFPFICALTALCVKTYFPIKTKAISQAITDGIQLHKEGKGATDPITGQENIDLLKLSPEEEDTAWLFENFSAKSLASLISTKSAKSIVVQMRKLFYTGMVSLILSLGIMLGTFNLISGEDQNLAIIPIIACIWFGTSVCFCGFNYLRFKDSKKLAQVLTQGDGWLEKTVSLLTTIKEYKEKGARSGDSNVSFLKVGDNKAKVADPEARCHFKDECDIPVKEKEVELSEKSEANTTEITTELPGTASNEGDKEIQKTKK